MTDEATPVSQEANPEGLTESQAVDSILKRWNKPEAAETSTEDAAPETTAETETEPSQDTQVEGEAETEDAADGHIEIDVGGQKFKAPKELSETFRQVEAKVKEIEAGATRKFQEAADLRKSAETQYAAVQQLQKVAEANAELLADHRMVARRLQQLEAVDIQATDADTLTRLNAEYNQPAASGRSSAIQRERQDDAGRAGDATRAKLEHAEKLLATRVKGGGRKAKALAEYAVGRGAPIEVLNGISDAWMVEILDDAAYGRQMRDSRPQITKRVAETQKTLRPGAAGHDKPGAAKAEEAMARVRKTGNVHDAAMALLARSSAEER
jgi:hypothetical protein